MSESKLPALPPTFMGEREDQALLALREGGRRVVAWRLLRNREEWGALWRLAYPASISTVARYAMGVIDTAFLGHLGTCELAASSVASVAMRVPGMLLWGSTQALCTLCAQAMGSGNKPLVGLWLQTGMVIFTVFSLVVALLWIFTVGPLLRLFAIDDDVVTMGVRYARWSTLWIWPNAMYQCLRWYFQAQNNVQPAMIINFVFIGVNAALNYVLIFGLGRWHGIGYIGSPVATAISIWLQLITYIIYMFAIRKYHIGTWPNWSLAEALKGHRVKTFMKQAVPGAATLAFTQWGTDATTLMSGSILGKVALAAQSASFNIMTALSALMSGIGLAVTTRVGHHLGARAPNLAIVASLASVIMTVIAGCILAAGVVAARDEYGRIFSTDHLVIREMAKVAPLVGPTILLTGIGNTLGSVLSGQGRPTVRAIAALLTMWFLNIPLAIVLLKLLHYGLDGIWLAMLSGNIGMAAILFVIVGRTDWASESAAAVLRSERKRRPATVAMFETSEGGPRHRLSRPINAAPSNSMDDSSYAGSFHSDIANGHASAWASSSALTLSSSLPAPMSPPLLEDADNHSDSGESTVESGSEDGSGPGSISE